MTDDRQLTAEELETLDEESNNVLAAGAVLAALYYTTARGLEVTPGPDAGRPFNELVVRVSFLKSAYLLTVTRIPDDDEPER